MYLRVSEVGYLALGTLLDIVGNFLLEGLGAVLNRFKVRRVVEGSRIVDSQDFGTLDLAQDGVGKDLRGALTGSFGGAAADDEVETVGASDGSSDGSGGGRASHDGESRTHGETEGGIWDSGRDEAKKKKKKTEETRRTEKEEEKLKWRELNGVLLDWHFSDYSTYANGTLGIH